MESKNRSANNQKGGVLQRKDDRERDGKKKEEEGIENYDKCEKENGKHRLYVSGSRRCTE